MGARLVALPQGRPPVKPSYATSTGGCLPVGAAGSESCEWALPRTRCALRDRDGCWEFRNPHDRRTMYLNHRPQALTVAARHPRMIVAAAAVAALAAASFALHPPATHAAQSKPAVVSTAKTSLGRIVVNS